MIILIRLKYVLEYVIGLPIRKESYTVIKYQIMMHWDKIGRFINVLLKIHVLD